VAIDVEYGNFTPRRPAADAAVANGAPGAQGAISLVWVDHIWQFWWLIFPLAGIVGGWFKGVQKWDEKRRRDKIELARIKYGQSAMGPADPQNSQAGASDTQSASAEATTSPTATGGASAAGASSTTEVERLLAEEQEVTRRWLDYELDPAKLIDFPVMTDMREPVTVDFHRAKQEVDRLHPADPDQPGELKDPEQLARYREAVREYTISFEIAEREAKRRRAADFAPAERQKLEKAKKLLALADDSGATQAERQSAYKRATRELEGLIVLPDAATQALQQRIAGVIPPAQA